MLVQGQILARGTAADSIIFTASSPQTGWKGIRFNDTPSSNDSSEFLYCILEYGDAYGNTPENSGGAIAAINYGKIIISHCSFFNNRALDLSLDPNPSGGAILLNTSSHIIKNCIFKNNESYAGGAILCYLGSNPKIENSVFISNVAHGADYAQGYGGAVCCFASSSPLIKNNTFSGNTVSNGGGAIAMVSQCNPIIDHNLIFGNTSE